MQLAPMTEADFKAFWPTFEQTVKARETYAFDPALSYPEARHLWCELPQVTYVAKQNNGEVLGSYYLKPNAAGPGDHVCNCGYMVTQAARGQGVAKTMCLHSQRVAVELGYRAIQFNAVVSTNTVAVALWQRLGFAIVGTVPNAYRHARLGLVDAHIMYKDLRPAHE
ncbi:GNAT family N-acetyltransferase [Halomonas sp. Bachu 37]|uniref:GNAT family N-acetyltransferase n=1 Tax=Halomonas kashgarensis TaxID=3084920 RepID=UPI0032167DF8